MTRQHVLFIGLVVACGNVSGSLALDEIVQTLDVRVVMYCECIGQVDPADIPRDCEQARYVEPDDIHCADRALANLPGARAYLQCRADAEARFNRCVTALQCEPWRPSECTTRLGEDTAACRELSADADDALDACSENFFANHPGT